MDLKGGNFWVVVCLFGLLMPPFFAQTYLPKNMKKPPILQKGDTVAVVATARKHLQDDFKATTELLQSWGLHVKIGSSIGLDYHQLAGTDEQRAQDLQDMLNDDSVKAIWCARGGYGSIRLLKHLNWNKFEQNPKWLIGFSDVTVLHQKIQSLGIQSIHGIMTVNIPRATPEAKQTLRKALFGEVLSYEIPSHPKNKAGKVQGTLVGGNLSLIYSLAGTPMDLRGEDLILYIEDLDEYLYHVDRMMMQLEYKGLLKQLKGLVVGSMTKMKDNDIPWGKDALEIIEDAMKPYAIPVIYHFPAGHIPDNRALIFGSKVVLEVNSESAKLVFE